MLFNNTFIIRRLSKQLKILAIETSCDDTAASIINQNSDESAAILSSVIIPQHEIHSKYKGIVPHLASQAHKKALPYAIKSALEIAKTKIGDIDIFAATRGPGIAGSLIVGFEAARLMSILFDKPFYPVHHLVILLILATNIYAGRTCFNSQASQCH